MDFQNSIKQICASRNDSWSKTVLGRIECVSDLHAADAVHHLICTNNFRTGLQIPQIFSDDESQLPKRAKKGMPNDSTKLEAFVSDRIPGIT